VSKRHFSVLLVLVVIAVLAVALLVPQDMGEENGPGRGLLLPGVGERINAVSRVTIQAGSDVDVTLQRAGEQWQIAELQGYPADFERLRELLAALAQASILEPKTDNPAYYERLGVQDPSDETPGAVRVAFDLENERLAVIVGKAASGRDGQYVRLDGEARSLLIDRELDVPFETIDWAGREIVDVASADVSEVEIIHPDGSWILASRQTAADTDFVLENLPEGREAVSSWSVNSLGGALAALRMDSVTAAAEEPPEDAVRFRFLTFAGLEYTGEAWQNEAGHWVHLRAAVPASTDGESGAGEAAPNAGAQAALAEAERVNRRLSAWWFAIPEYKHTNLTKRLDQLLKPQEESGAGDS
jgi:hypothetical protein